MSLIKRVKGDFTIESIDSGTSLTLNQTGGLTINGDLTILGAHTTVSSTDTTIADNIIVLNSGETGAGVTKGTSGIDVDRGTLPTVEIRFNELTGHWEATDDGTAYYVLNAVGTGSTDLVNDTTPQLGGNLDVNGYLITSAANGDIVLVANGTGQVKINQGLSLESLTIDPTAVTGYNIVYAKAVGTGDTGLYVSNTSIQGELISKQKAIFYSLLL